MSPRDPRSAPLRAVAPLVVLGDTPAYVGPVTLVANAGKLVGVTSLELLRPQQGLPLAVMTSLDGAAHVAVTRWTMGRYTGLGILELAPLATPFAADIEPLGIEAVSASPDARGAPAALVTLVPAGRGFARVVVPVHVDADDGGGMSDQITRLASAIEPADAAVAADGAPLFAWFAAEPALGRPSEVLAVAVSSPYRAALAQPRATPVLGELIGLEDLGRTLIAPSTPDERAELAQVAGEIVE